MQPHPNKPLFNFNFIAMTGAYFFGVFNDNFFKQAIMLLAVSVGFKELQGIATVVFTLPYLVFASSAGWLSDRYPKKNIVISAKILEVLAMSAGALGLYFFQPSDAFFSPTWLLFLVMIGLMGLHASIFSPALNGSIPEIFPENQVTKINGIIKSAVTIAILLGISSAGFILNTNPALLSFSLKIIGALILGVALLGLLFSFWIKKPAHTPSKTHAPFPVLGFIQSIKDVYQLKKDPILRISVWANTVFWLMGILLVSLINEMGFFFGWGENKTSLMIAFQMIGLAVGSVLTNKITQNRKWYATLVPALFMMGLCLFVIHLISALSDPYRYYFILSLVFCSGISGGLYMIPLESFIQIRPQESEKGKIIACGNFMSLSAVSLGGLLYFFLSQIKISLNLWFILLASINLTVCAALFFALAKYELKEKTAYHGGRNLLDRFILFAGKSLLRLRYRVRVIGLSEIKAKGTKGILFLPNHEAYTDPLILYSKLNQNFHPRSVAVESVLTHPVVRWIALRLGARQIADVGIRGFLAKSEVEATLQETIQDLNAGENILLYPSGRVKYQAREIIGSNSSVSTILKQAINPRVILVKISGLWGSSFSRANGEPSLPRNIVRKVLSSFIFFVPKRLVTLEFYEPKDFPCTGTLNQINTYLESFYNQTLEPNTYIPYSLWEKGKPRILPEPEEKKQESQTVIVPAAVREIVLAYLTEKTGQTLIKDFDYLSFDLGMDSLMIGETLIFLNQEFGFAGGDPDSFQTVADLLFAASGKGVVRSQIRISPPSVKWRHNVLKAPLEMPAGDSIPEVFLKAAKKNPSQVIIADQISGEKTYRDIILSILVLKPLLKKIEGSALGLMFPAGAAADIFYLAALFAGKIPVMMNWTAGIKNIQSCLKNSGVKKILTSKTMLTKLQNQGINLDELVGLFLFAEEFKSKLTLANKIQAFFRSRFCWTSLRKAALTETAVVLFTSGSETEPKSVPLSHKNILTNLNDLNQIIDLYSTDVMMGFLPPFHSFGLSVTSLFPLCMNLPTVYHSNPTESAMIAKIAKLYQVTLLISTPTFLQGIINAAQVEDLKNFRIIVTGAEKCPENLYLTVAKKCPQAKILEGYGITECSPVVSVNDEKNPVPQTIGKILPSLEYRILSAENFVSVAVNQQGLLFVRGASVFSGYLNYQGESPFIQIEGQTWYKTGDIVSEDSAHILTFHARLKRFAKIGGEMVSLPAIEEVLKKRFEDPSSKEPQLAVEASETQGTPELVLFTITPIDRKQANETIRDAGLSPIHNIKQIRLLKEIPVLGTGKIDYRSLKTML